MACFGSNVWNGEDLFCHVVRVQCCNCAVGTSAARLLPHSGRELCEAGMPAITVRSRRLVPSPVAGQGYPPSLVVQASREAHQTDPRAARHIGEKVFNSRGYALINRGLGIHFPFKNRKMRREGEGNITTWVQSSTVDKHGTATK